MNSTSCLALLLLAVFLQLQEVDSAGGSTRRKKHQDDAKAAGLRGDTESSAGTPDASAASTQYILGSFPKLRQILYVCPPDTSWRPLVVSGLQFPEAIAVDKLNWRLFIADKTDKKIYWYQLIALPDGKLITDGRQHIAVEAVFAKYVAVDPVGNLYFTGQLELLAPLVSEPGLFKQDTIALATGLTTNPKTLWNTANTGERLFMPAGFAVDSFNVFWGNAEAGTTHGSVVRAPITPPDVSAVESVLPMADNANEVMALALTPTNLFYSTTNGIYGISKNKESGTCGTDGQDCTREILNGHVTSMIWDGDGTVYAAVGNPASEIGKGKVYAFASNTVQTDVMLREVVSAPGVWGVEVLEITSSAATDGAAVVLAAVMGNILLSLFQ